MSLGWTKSILAIATLGLLGGCTAIAGLTDVPNPIALSDATTLDSGTLDASDSGSGDATVRPDAPADVTRGPEADAPLHDAPPDTASADSSDAHADSYTVGGTVVGLATGASLVLQDNNGDDLTVTTNGPFTFSTPLSAGAAFSVSITSQPVDQTCTVMGAMGTVGSADVTSVMVSCVATEAGTGPEGGSSYMLGGQVSGLSGTLVLADGDGDTVTITSNGSFAFPVTLASGATYAIYVVSEPTSPAETCTVTNGSGTVVGMNVANVLVACVAGGYSIGGTLSGLSANDSVILQDNLGDNLPLTQNGPFSFSTTLPGGVAYSVTVLSQPSSPVEVCMVTSGMGMVGGPDAGPDSGANVSGVMVACVPSAYSVGGTLVGLPASSSIVLTNNGGDALTLSANGAFTFASQVTSGGVYDVVIKTQPAGQTCSVVGGTGTVNGGAVSSVVVNCLSNSYTVGGTVSGLAASDQVAIQLNMGTPIFVSANGTFAFSTPLPMGTAYTVALAGSPSFPVAQTCTIAHPSGTIGASNVTNVVVSCTTSSFTISGTLTGLASSDAVTVEDNGGDDYTFMVGSGPGSVPFTFATAVPSGGAYSVTFLANPTAPIAQSCIVSATSPTPAAGTVSDANVTGIQLVCTTQSFTVGGTIAGLASGDTLTFQDSSGSTAPIAGGAASTPFTLPGTLPSGSPYSVTIAAQGGTGPSQTCTVSGNTGTVGSADVTSVSVTCTTNSFPMTLGLSGLTGTSNSVVVRNTVAGGFCSTSPYCALTTNTTDPLGMALSGTKYSFEVVTNPTDPIQSCTPTTAAPTAGTVAASPVTVSVACSGVPENVGGTVTGLDGILTLNDEGVGGGDYMVTSNGSYVGWTPPAGSAYDVVPVANNPACSQDVCFTGAGTANQSCTITGGSGTANGAVTTVNVVCATASFTLGGTLTGLNAFNMLSLTSGQASPQTVTITTGTAYTFATSVLSGTTFNVGFTAQTGQTASTSPAKQTLRTAGTGPLQCTLANDAPGAGTPGNPTYMGNANVSGSTGVNISCVPAYTVGGTLRGLASGNSITLADAVGYQSSALGTDTVTLPSSTSTFSLPEGLASGDTYAVSISAVTHGSGSAQQCKVVSGTGSGTMESVDVSSVEIECGYAGAACASTADCLSGFCPTSGAGAGFCQASLDNQSCGLGADCYSGTCTGFASGTCTAVLHGLGGTCGAAGSTDCASNQVCTVLPSSAGGAATCRLGCAVDTGKATSQNLNIQTGAELCGDGEGCAANDDCGSGLCSASAPQTGTCQPSTCAGQLACGAFGVCHASPCPAEGANGATCAAAGNRAPDCDTASCSSALKCQSQACAPTCGTGTPCNSSSDCASASCSASHLCN